MHMEFVDLYQYYGYQRPQNGVGKLTCWWAPTSDRVSPGRKKPGVLIIPGGAYWHVSPREAEPVALRFLAKGYSAFVLEYSCAPAVFPTALREAAMAMRYIRQNADTYELDPGMIAATGFSAGGHLCGTLGTMYDAREVADIAPAAVIRPDALGLCYPVAVEWGRTHNDSFVNLTGGDAQLRYRLSLDRLVRSDMPPVFLWHTRNDASVPCRNSLVLAQALEEAGVDFALHVYRDGPHGLSTADAMAYPVQDVPQVSWDVTGWVEAEIRFFQEIGFKIRDLEVK